jgi:hypothetical protein
MGLLERQWFAALVATRRMETECRQLLNALRQADAAWRQACGQLEAFEALSDALEAQMSSREQPRFKAEPLRLAEASAA